MTFHPYLLLRNYPRSSYAWNRAYKRVSVLCPWITPVHRFCLITVLPAYGSGGVSLVLRTQLRQCQLPSIIPCWRSYDDMNETWKCDCFCRAEVTPDASVCNSLQLQLICICIVICDCFIWPMNPAHDMIPTSQPKQQHMYSTSTYHFLLPYATKYALARKSYLCKLLRDQDSVHSQLYPIW